MINYDLLHKSTEFYTKKGYQRIESPWMVTEYIDNITRPRNATPYIVKSLNKNLVASGEQSFLYLFMKDYLPKGRYQTITPCFRNEPYDWTHSKVFMKNELIITDIVTTKTLGKIVEDAKDFFDSIGVHNLHVVSTSEGYDIYSNTVELGSYGIRECKFLKWVYGTGIAEPRTSKILWDIINNK